MSAEGLPKAAAIQTAKNLVAELRLGQYTKARRLHGVLGEQIHAAEEAQRHSEEAEQ